MSRSIRILLVLMGACASTVLASAQAASSPTGVSNTAPGISSPVAYIYVANSPSSGRNQIKGYAAAPNGALATIPGSPFSSRVSYIALNGGWLFGTDGVNIDSFSIASNGSLSLVDTLEVESQGGLVNLFLDHTGTSLYTDYYTTNNEYLAYGIDNSTGKLTYINNVMGGPSIGYVVSFIGNNEFAYGSSCYHFTPEIYGLQRASNGAITSLASNPAFPATQDPGFYCPWSAAADPTNNVAVGMQPLTSDWGVAGPYQLATYTADSSGNLTTSSTYANMPSVAVGNINDYWMSPSGNLLAVSGDSGLQVFHFNGSNPITGYTGLLVTDYVDQVFWDNSNHLYALGRTAGKLWVFTVTPTGVKQAPGSPHSIVGPVDMIVLPK